MIISIKKIIAYLLVLALLTMGIIGLHMFSSKGIPSRAVNTDLATDFFAKNTLSDELNIQGRRIRDFQIDCDFFNFSEYSKLSMSLIGAAIIPNTAIHVAIIKIR